MNRKRTRLGMLALLAFSTMTVAAFATAYTWVGGSSGDWDADAEWDESGYPDGSDDDATIATDTTVTLVNECIDDLTIDEDVTIAGSGTLEVDTIEIIGPAELTQSGQAQIKTVNICPPE
jgi:hypothetical protein